jgi:hypothetical protein
MNINKLLERIRGNISYRLSRIEENQRGLDDIEKDIKKLIRYTDFTPTDPFEEDSKKAYQNALGRLRTIRHALNKKKEKLESS